MDQEQRRRRMRAARAIGGYKSTADLANVIPKDAELGDRTLRKLESGESELRPPAMREIAAACGLPYEFFTVDFNRLPEIAQAAEPPQPDLRETMAAIEERLRLLEAERAADDLEDIARSEEEQQPTVSPRTRRRQ